MTKFEIVEGGILKVTSTCMVARLNRGDFDSVSFDPKRNLLRFDRRNGRPFDIWMEGSDDVLNSDFLKLCEMWFDGWEPGQQVKEESADASTHD